MHNSQVYTSILKNTSILYVEDDYNTQEIIAEILREFCTTVKLASNGKDALKILHKDRIDLLITDIEMPYMDGLNLLKTIRDDTGVQNLPVIINSAYTREDYLLSSIDLNVLAYIVKPISYKKIEDALFKAAKSLNSTQGVYFKIAQDLYYDKENGSLYEGNRSTPLQKKERDFLNLLIDSKGSVVSYSTIERSIWSSYDDVMTSYALRTVVKKLRQKTDTNFIQNVSGFGYKLITE